MTDYIMTTLSNLENESEHSANRDLLERFKKLSDERDEMALLLKKEQYKSKLAEQNHKFKLDCLSSRLKAQEEYNSKLAISNNEILQQADTKSQLFALQDKFDKEKTFSSQMQANLIEITTRNQFISELSNINDTMSTLSADKLLSALVDKFCQRISLFEDKNLGLIKSLSYKISSQQKRNNKSEVFDSAPFNELMVKNAKLSHKNEELHVKIIELNDRLDKFSAFFEGSLASTEEFIESLNSESFNELSFGSELESLYKEIQSDFKKNKRQMIALKKEFIKGIDIDKIKENVVSQANTQDSSLLEAFKKEYQLLRLEVKEKEELVEELTEKFMELYDKYNFLKEEKEERNLNEREYNVEAENMGFKAEIKNLKEIIKENESVIQRLKEEIAMKGSQKSDEEERKWRIEYDKLKIQLAQLDREMLLKEEELFSIRENHKIMVESFEKEKIHLEEWIQSLSKSINAENQRHEDEKMMLRKKYDKMRQKAIEFKKKAEG